MGQTFSSGCAYFTLSSGSLVDNADFEIFLEYKLNITEVEKDALTRTVTRILHYIPERIKLSHGDPIEVKFKMPKSLKIGYQGPAEKFMQVHPVFFNGTLIGVITLFRNSSFGYNSQQAALKSTIDALARKVFFHFQQSSNQTMGDQEAYT